MKNVQKYLDNTSVNRCVTFSLQPCTDLEQFLELTFVRSSEICYDFNLLFFKFQTNATNLFTLFMLYNKDSLADTESADESSC